MKIVLITTTIRIPKVLKLYREFNKDVLFIVTGDKKTPHTKVNNFIKELGNAIYYNVEDQIMLGYKCSDIIGWNKITRRNISLLEALRYGADIIISIDDDNIPLNKKYFTDFETILTTAFNGLKAYSDSKWLNIGEFLVPPVYHRGFPYALRHRDLETRLKPVIGQRVGIAAGLWFGDPDIDAMERITNAPIVHQTSEVLRHGVIVDRSHFTPVNSQNTAYIAELASLMMMLEGVGRYQDIWASYIAERVMRDMNYHVYFGKPFVWQERRPQNLWRNLKDELFGMEWTLKFCQDLLDGDLGGGTIIDKLDSLYEHLSTLDYLPSIVHELGRAWLEDIETIT